MIVLIEREQVPRVSLSTGIGGNRERKMNAGIKQKFKRKR